MTIMFPHIPDYEAPASAHSVNYALAPPTLWVTAHVDWSSISVHLSEIEALRYAIDNGMPLVRQVRPGTCLIAAMMGDGS